MLLALLNVLLVPAKTINGCCMFSFTHPIELYLFTVRKNSVVLRNTGNRVPAMGCMHVSKVIHEKCKAVTFATESYKATHSAEQTLCCPF